MTTSPPNPPAPHRLRRYRTIYDRVSARLAEFGAVSELRSADGTPLHPPTAALLSAPTLSASSPAPIPHGDAIWIPLGTGRADAFIRVVAAPASADFIGRTAAWLARDADRLFQLEQATGELGSRLAENYEQMHVLFGLARMIDGVEDVRAGVARVLDEVRSGLPFAWIAVLFVRGHELRPEVSGRLLVSGAGRCDPSDIRAACEQLLAAPESNATDVSAADSPSLRMIFPGDPSGLADLLGTELAAAPIRYEGHTVAILLAGEKLARASGPGVSSHDESALSSFETKFLAACSDLLSVFHENLTRFADQRALFVGTVRALTSAIDAKHPYTRGHSERVALLARETARALGLGEQTAKTYHLTGLLHDVGKIGVPEHILSKPDRLTDDEFALIKTHPRVGHEILRGIPHLEEVLPGVLHHHEAFDGRGYPDRLAGHDIPLIARVLALCDTFDAMSSSRSYRASLSRQTVLAEIRKCAGTQFDPDLAAVFLELDFTPFDALVAEHGEPLTRVA